MNDCRARRSRDSRFEPRVNLVHHRQRSQYFQDFLHQLVDHQWLIASATTELGVGGDLRSSICAVETTGDRFRLVKKAPVISYGEHADQILVLDRGAIVERGTHPELLANRGTYYRLHAAQLRRDEGEPASPAATAGAR